MKKLPAFALSVAAVGFVATAGFAAQSVLAPAAAARCTGNWSIVMGGLQVGFVTGTGQDSTGMTGNQRVGYNTADPVGGLAELDRLVNKHRSECPRDHIKLMAHSEGAGITHAWVTAHNGFGNVNAVLLADPKRVAGPGWAGLASVPGNGIIGYPLAGVDDWFGDIPVLSVCNHDDMVCNTEAGWFGYLTGAHGRYNWDSNSYSNWGSGVRFQ